VRNRLGKSGANAWSRALVSIGATALLAACSGHGGTASNSVMPDTTTQSKGLSPDVTVTDIYGGGSSLAAPTIRLWGDYYGVALPPDAQGAPNGLAVNPDYQYYYASVGSGAGQNAFLSQTSSTVAPSSSPEYCANGVTTCYPYPGWEFSASDAIFTAEQTSCYDDGGECSSTLTLPAAVEPVRGQYLELPILDTDITFFYNPSGQTVPAGGLNLSRNTYCGIWEGTTTSWADPTITADNGGVVVSNQNITRVVRSDSSGSTDLVTNHLNTVCQNLANPAFDWTGGVGQTITWPAGSPVDSGKGGSGVVSEVNSVAGSIGYVGPSYVAPVVSGGLPTINLQNQYYFAKNSETFITPTITSTTAAFKGVAVGSNPDDPYDLGVLVPNPTGETAYPIVGNTWLLIYQCYPKSAQRTAVTDFVKWYATTTTSSGPTPADSILNAEGEAPITNTWKGDVKADMPDVYVGPKSGICTT